MFRTRDMEAAVDENTVEELVVNPPRRTKKFKLAPEAERLLAEARDVNRDVNRLRGEHQRVLDSLTCLDWTRLRAKYVGTHVSGFVATAMRRLTEVNDAFKVSDKVFSRFDDNPATITKADLDGYRELAAEVSRGIDALADAVRVLHESISSQQ